MNENNNNLELKFEEKINQSNNKTIDRFLNLQDEKIEKI